MKIGLIVEYLSGRGGTQRQALELARNLVAAGHEVDVVTLDHDPAECHPEIAAGLGITAVRTLQGGRTASAPVLTGRARRSAGELLRRSGGIYALQYRIMKRSYGKLLAIARPRADRWDVINPHDYGPAAWVASTLSRTCRKPVVWQCNDPLYRWERPSLFARPVLDWVLKKDRDFVAEIQAVTVLDSRVAAEVHARYEVTPEVVRSGVDLAMLGDLPSQRDARQELGLSQAAQVVLVLTNLNSPHRRVEDAIVAHSMCGPRCHLLLAAPAGASGRYTEKIERAILASPASTRITWRKERLRGEGELRTLLAAADVFLFPNVRQTWGLAVIEAAAAGLPVVVSDQSGASEVFENERNAIIYPGGDVEQLAHALKRLLDDAALRSRIATAGKAMVRGSFSWARYAADMANAFERTRAAWAATGGR